MRLPQWNVLLGGERWRETSEGATRPPPARTHRRMTGRTHQREPEGEHNAQRKALLSKAADSQARNTAFAPTPTARFLPDKRVRCSGSSVIFRPRVRVERTRPFATRAHPPCEWLRRKRAPAGGSMGTQRAGQGVLRFDRDVAGACVERKRYLKLHLDVLSVPRCPAERTPP